jgi:hypothetical protein
MWIKHNGKYKFVVGIEFGEYWTRVSVLEDDGHPYHSGNGVSGILFSNEDDCQQVAILKSAIERQSVVEL